MTIARPPDNSHHEETRKKVSLALDDMVRAVSLNSANKTFRPEHLGKKVRRTLEDVLCAFGTHGGGFATDCKSVARVVVCALTGVRTWDYTSLPYTDPRVEAAYDALYKRRHSGETLPAAYGDSYKTEREKAEDGAKPVGEGKVTADLREEVEDFDLILLGMGG